MVKKKILHLFGNLLFLVEVLGMFCMEGTGAISHVSVRNKPEIFNEPGMFAAISVKGIKNGAKLLEGPVPDWKKFGQRDAGNGSGGATTGLAAFSQCFL